MAANKKMKDNCCTLLWLLCYTCFTTLFFACMPDYGILDFFLENGNEFFVLATTTLLLGHLRVWLLILFFVK